MNELQCCECFHVDTLEYYGNGQRDPFLAKGYGVQAHDQLYICRDCQTIQKLIPAHTERVASGRILRDASRRAEAALQASYHSGQAQLYQHLSQTGIEVGASFDDAGPPPQIKSVEYGKKNA